MSDTLEIFGVEYLGVTGIKATDDNNQIKTYIRPQGTKSITANGVGIDVSAYATADVSVSGSSPVLQTITKSYTPTESQQTETITASGGYDGIQEVDVTVGAISSTYVGSGITQRTSIDLYSSGATVNVPSGYYASSASKAISNGTEGTPTATKGVVNSHSINITPSVTNTAGYISGGTHTGTAVSVSASELVSGTYSVTSSGTKDVTNYASASVPSGSATPASSISATGATVSTSTNTLTLTKSSVSNTPQVSAGYVSSGTAGNSSVSLSATVTTKGATTYTPTTSAQTIASGTYLTGTQTISGDANLVAGNIKKDISIFGVTGSFEGGGGGTSMTVDTATKTLTSTASSISFTSLSGEPTSWVVTSSANQSTGGTKVVSVVYDGTSCHGMDITTQAEADTGFTQSYSSGTLTITATTALFQANEYKLVYTYGGTSGNISTADVQVGSGATSITFTGLGDEPDYFSCIFKSTFSTSSGYQRVMDVVYDGANTYGHALDSSAKALTSWSYSYSSGTLTISSTGTNDGGYFHQPGYYQLTYAIGGEQTLQTKTVTPTESTQNVTADTAQGYTALKKVVVNPIPSSYVQPTATKGATTYTPTTTSQTIASGTYLTGVQTISGDANLVAGNIKSGTSIFGVTGSYGGGGASNVAQGTFSTGSTRNTTGSVTISYSGSGYPIALMVYVNGGAYNNTSGGDTTWYNSVNRYDVGTFYMTKSETTTTPTYTNSGSQNYGVNAIIYKNSTSNATSYTRNSSMTSGVYAASGTNASSALNCVKFKGNGTTLSYYVGNASSSYIGLAPSTTYAYIVVYSS